MIMCGHLIESTFSINLSVGRWKCELFILGAVFFFFLILCTHSVYTYLNAAYSFYDTANCT